MPKFPYGKVPFWILLIAISTGIFNLVVALSKRGEKPDLVFVSFARSHMEAYEEATEEFQKEHGVKVQLQLVSARTVKSRLQNAFLLIKADLLKDLSYRPTAWIDIATAHDNGNEVVFNPNQYIYSALIPNQFKSRVIRNRRTRSDS